MKVALALFIAALPFGSGTSTRLRGTPQQALRVSTEGDFSLGVNVSFSLDTGNDLTAKEERFVKNCIRRSYNTVHDINAAVVKFADLLSKDKAPAGARALSTYKSTSSTYKSKYQPFNWVLGATANGICRLCGGRRLKSGASAGAPVSTVQDFHLDQRRASWERALCGKLRGGPHATFHSISNCTISTYQPETGNNNDAVEQVDMGVTSNFTIPYDRALSANEQLFANECLRLSYNEVHDPSVVFMDKTDLKSQTYQGDDAMNVSETSGSFSWALEWVAHASFRRPTTNDDDNKNSLLSFSESAPTVHEQQHKRWQASFCDKLHAGPFDIFQSVEDCQIMVNDITPN